MKKDAVAILGKTLLYIVAVAMTFALIVLAWEEYDWLPTVKDIIRGVVVPMLLGGLTVFLLRHEYDVLKDKWKPFVMLIVFLTGTFVLINAGIIVQEACAKVMKVDSITTLSNEEIKRANYLQIESVEPDTSSYNYLFDDAVIPHRRGAHTNFWFYQVCPLKNKKGIFLCTRTKETHPYRTISEDRLQQWRTDFINREKGSIKKLLFLRTSSRFSTKVTITNNIKLLLPTALLVMVSSERRTLFCCKFVSRIPSKDGWTTCSIFSVPYLSAFLCS